VISPTKRITSNIIIPFPSAPLTELARTTEIGRLPHPGSCFSASVLEKADYLVIRSAKSELCVDAVTNKISIWLYR
jgi:hypothetical protein